MLLDVLDARSELPCRDRDSSFANDEQFPDVYLVRIDGPSLGKKQTRYRQVPAAAL